MRTPTPLLALALLGLSVPASPVGAQAPPASKTAARPSPGPPAAARQIGVVRRGSVPVLPPADGALRSEASRSAFDLVPVDAWLGRVVAPTADVFRMPDVRSAWVSRLQRGQQVAVVSQWQGFFCILMGDGSRAYVPQTHVELLPYRVKSVARTAPPPAPPAPSESAMLRPASGTLWEQPERPGDSIARRVIEEALRYEGTPYVYGGNSERGIDCSGLVRNCFAAAGIQLPRRASEQAQVGEPVPLDRLQPGDRIYFSVSREDDHTGIYLGNGYFIHAGRTRGKVAIDHLSTPLYGNHLCCARR